MKTNFNISTVVFCAILVASSFVLVFCSDSKHSADDSKAATKENEEKFNNSNMESDAKFLVDATNINFEEIQWGKLAQQKGINAEVKGLGKMMEAAHNKSLKEVMILAKTKQVTVPETFSDKSQETYSKLNDKSGNDFDKAYCDLMVEGHKHAIIKFENEAADSQDEEIRAWASSTLPELRKHLDHALACQKKVEKM